MANNNLNQTYLVATIRPWNIEIFHTRVTHFPGTWHLVTDPTQLTVDRVNEMKPRYIFFPHWSDRVPEEILNGAECVCFHETDLPYGRGGSPIQNLIARGHRETQITALRMVTELDAGPVYLKRPLRLDGSAREIFTRASRTVAEMMKEIAHTQPVPMPQEGTPTVFKRRTPKESEIHNGLASLEQIYDHIRMLDAPEYPAAFTDIHGFHLRFHNAAIDRRTGEVTATVSITRKEPS